MHDGMPYGRNQGQGHSREVDRQSPTGLIFILIIGILLLESVSMPDTMALSVGALCLSVSAGPTKLLVILT